MLPYHIGKSYEIFHTNCTDWMKLQPDNYINLTLTSPPYDNIRDYQGFSFDFEPMADELIRITKQGGVIIWNVADAIVDGGKSGTSMRQSLYFMEHGMNLHDTMIYAKKNPMPTNVKTKRYHQAWEYLFVFSKGIPTTFNPIMVKAKYSKCNANMKHRGKNGNMEYTKTSRNEMTKVRNIFEYSIGGGHTTSDKEAYGHPALMPEKLASDMITTWSNPGDLLFDPFMGSGTTGKMARHENRKFIGCEISEEYCDLAITRINKTASAVFYDLFSDITK